MKLKALFWNIKKCVQGVKESKSKISIHVFTSNFTYKNKINIHLW